MIVANHRVCFTAFPSSSPQAKVRSETVFRFVVFGTVRASVSGYHVGHIGYLTNAKGENLIQEDQIRKSRKFPSFSKEIMEFSKLF